MQSKMILLRSEFYMLILFLLGSNSVLETSWGVGQDTWIALLLVLTFGSFFVLMHARIVSLFPGKNLYDIAESIFGKIVGKIITILLIGYAIYLSIIVIKIISEFIKIVNLIETPALPIVALLLITAAYLTFSGITTLKKWIIFVWPIYFLILIYILLIAIPEMNPANILPIFEHSMMDIGKESLKIFTTSFTGIILFLTLENFIKPNENPYQIYFLSFLVAMIILTIIFFINAMVLGIPMLKISYFPIYTVARLSDIGDFLSRVEMLISFSLIFAGIAKISICLLAAVKGVKNLLYHRNEGFILFILSIIVLAISVLGFSSIIDLLDFIEFYQVYVLVFQITLSVLIWIGAELKVQSSRFNGHKKQ